MHVSKNSETNSGSEIVSSVDSRNRSSSSVDSSDGSGEEGITISGSNAAATSATAPSGATLPAHLSPLKIIVGTFCALTAIRRRHYVYVCQHPSGPQLDQLKQT
jgi:hypothetical protein